MIPAFDNECKINSISIKPTKIHCFCPLGQGWCTYQVSMEIEPDKKVPDYLEIANIISALDASEHTIEDAIAILWRNVHDYINPKGLCVRIDCDDAKHMPVSVTKISD